MTRVTWEGISQRFTEGIIQWFKTNTPLTLEASGIDLVVTRQKLAKGEESFIRIGSFSLCVACGFYGATVILAAVASGVPEYAAYHVAILAGLIVATLMVVFRKKIKTSYGKTRRRANDQTAQGLARTQVAA
jgi:hypothetical protein